MEENEVIVSIFCLVYNHEKYLKQALDGIISQNTNFCFEVIIHDDASTDNSAAILKEYQKKYPKLIHVIYQKENQYSKKIKIFETYIRPRIRGKYIAICECDDYWCDSNKLQTQVDYLEQNPKCIMTAHAGRICYENGIFKRKDFRPFNQDCIVANEYLMSKWLFPTASILYRAELQDHDNPFVGNAPCGDVPLVLYAATKGYIYYFDRVMSVYRKGGRNSLTTQWNNNPQLLIDVNERFIGMLDRFDKYTNFKYSEYIDRFRKDKEYNNLILKRDFQSIKNVRYDEFYNCASISRKTKVFFRCYFPRLCSWLIKLKCNVDYLICVCLNSIK